MSSNAAQEFVNQLQYVERLIGENRLKDAARILNTLAKTAPEDPRLFLLGSLMAEAAQNSEGMLTAAQKAVALAPGWPVATIRLAGVYMILGQADQAIHSAAQALEEAIQESTLSSELLTRAAAIAVKSQDYPKAASWAAQASKLEPGNPQLKHLWAEALAFNQQFEEAISLYTELLTQTPENTAILLDRLLAYISTGQKGLALQDADRLLASDHQNETYLYYATLLKGETPPTQPASVVQRLFNFSAPHFDGHVVDNLLYKLPHDVAQMILNWYPDKQVDVLDLGCGTGLLGASLGPLKGVIVGVDLSSEMIRHAHQHNVYAQFNQVNILDALQATPAQHYDVITALNVLIYVGDLNPVIPNAHRILAPRGRFVFSCETAPKKIKTYALSASHRFVHQKAHTQKLLQNVGFSDIQIEDCTLRLENGEPVQGFVVTAQK